VELHQYFGIATAQEGFCCIGLHIFRIADTNIMLERDPSSNVSTKMDDKI
jgi:hypothetical protein